MFKRSLAAGVACAAIVSGSAFAATSTINNFTVSIAITAGCTISATNINFGAVQGNVLLTTAQTSTAAMGGLLTYHCTANNGVAPVLTNSTGLNPSGTQAQMLGATTGSFIPYNLNIPAIAAFDGTAQTAQITATIPTVPAVPAVDTYSDTVTLTLTY